MAEGPSPPGYTKPRQSYFLFGSLAVGLLLLLWFLSASVEREPDASARPAPASTEAPTPGLPSLSPDSQLRTGDEPRTPQTEAVPRGDPKAPVGSAEVPPIYEPWREAPPPLRGVSGLVRDATTHAPIPGAWIAWRLPPPEVSEQVLAGARPRDPAFTMLSDDAGRFRLDRLPDDALLQSKSPRVSSKLFAVAKGYAYGALTVGLARDVLFELQPMGSVDVDVSGEDGDPPRLSVVTLRPKRGAQGSITAVALSDTIVRLRHLPPGPCEVSVDPEDGGLPVTVNVAPGRVTTVRLKRPAFLPLAGTLTMQGQTVEARLRFERTPRHVGRVFQVKTDAFGRFELRVPAGRYIPYWYQAETESYLRIGDELEAGTLDAQLNWEPMRLVDVELRLSRRGGLETSEFTLCSTEPTGGSIVQLKRDSGSADTFRARVLPGAYTLVEATQFAGRQDVLTWRDVRAPGVHSVSLEILSTQVTWGGLEGLLPNERVRGEFKLSPIFDAARPSLLQGPPREFHTGLGQSTDSLRTGSTGRYVLEGASDLGTFRVELDLPASGGVRIDLGASAPKRYRGD